MRIAFMHNLRVSNTEDEAEFDTSSTVQAIIDALKRLGHEVDVVEVSGTRFGSGRKRTATRSSRSLPTRAKAASTSPGEPRCSACFRPSRPANRSSKRSSPTTCPAGAGFRTRTRARTTSTCAASRASRSSTARNSSRTTAPSGRLREALVGLQREFLDVEVEVGFDRRVYGGKRRRDRHVFRVVGVLDQKTSDYHLYMTNVPATRLQAADIAETYRLRWQIELLFKELKQHYRLDQLPSAKKPVVETLIFAAILTLVASHALLDALRRRLPTGRTIPPLRWAAVFDAMAPMLLTMVIDAVTYRRAPTDPWMLLLAQAVDPNLARPSALAERICYAH